jgi:hypothetical protein
MRVADQSLCFLCICGACSTLWDAGEQQPEVCSTRGLALYTCPQPQAVAQDVLRVMAWAGW